VISRRGTGPSSSSRVFGTAIALFKMMLTTLTAPDLTWLFLAVVISLLSVAVWAFWEIEQRSQRHRKRDRFG
jgi:hypothetical protein